MVGLRSGLWNPGSTTKHIQTSTAFQLFGHILIDSMLLFLHTFYLDTKV